MWNDAVLIKEKHFIWNDVIHKKLNIDVNPEATENIIKTRIDTQ